MINLLWGPVQLNRLHIHTGTRVKKVGTVDLRNNNQQHGQLATNENIQLVILYYGQNVDRPLIPTGTTSPGYLHLYNMLLFSYNVVIVRYQYISIGPTTVYQTAKYWQYTTLNVILVPSHWQIKILTISQIQQADFGKNIHHIIQTLVR